MKRITSDGHTGCNTLSEFGCSGIMWTPNGQSIIYVTARSSLPALFRTSVNGGASEPETTYPAIGSFTHDGTRFVYSQHTSSDSPAVWRADFAIAGGTLIKKGKIISSQFPEMDRSRLQTARASSGCPCAQAPKRYSPAIPLGTIKNNSPILTATQELLVGLPTANG